MFRYESHNYLRQGDDSQQNCGEGWKEPMLHNLFIPLPYEELSYSWSK